MILDVYKDGFEFASRKFSTLFVLGALSFFNILIIPAVFFYGYNYRVVKLATQSMINGDDVPPEFNDFKQMFIDGLKYIVVVLCYLIVPAIIIAVSILGRPVNVLLLVVGLILFGIESIPNGQYEAAQVLGYNRLETFFIIILPQVIKIVLPSITNEVITLVKDTSLSFVLAILGITVGGTYINLIGTIIINFVLLFIVAPYLSLFQARCGGLIYNLGS